MDHQNTRLNRPVHKQTQERKGHVEGARPSIFSSREGLVAKESTYTQVVNAHGGLLGLEMEISAGQQFLLTNSKTGVARECSVVRTQQSPSTQGLLVAFQFATPSPDFWPIVFPPKDWQALESQVAAQKK